MSILKEKTMDQRRERIDTATTAIPFPIRPGKAQQQSIDKVKMTIVFREEIYRNIIEYCLMDKDERGCFIFGGISRYGDNLEVYAQSMLIPPDSSYKNRDGGYIRISAEYLLKILDNFEFTDAQAIVAVHSHPLSYNSVEFSSIDLRAFHNTALHCLRRKNGVYTSLVLGQNDVFSGMFTTYPGGLNKDVSLKIVGDNGIRRLPEPEAIFELSRLDRQLPIFGKLGQQRISAVKLAVVGVGGVGSYFTSMAAHHGITNLILVDFDLVEESNLNRLASAGCGDVGKKKVDIAKRNVENISNKIQCRTLSLSIQDAMDELREADVIASCVDNDEARLILQELCSKYYKPLLDFGAGGRVKDGKILNLGSHVRLYFPGSSCICCMGLDPTKIQSESWLENRRHAGYIDGLNETPVQVVHINAIAASVGIKLLAWYLSGQGVNANFIQYNSLEDTMTALSLTKHESCPICGVDGIEGMGDVMPMGLTAIDGISLDDIGKITFDLSSQQHNEQSDKIRSKLRRWFRRRVSDLHKSKSC